MGKTAKQKRDPLQNPRSRAAKRATSPSIDLDKSLKENSRVSETPVLAAVHNSGIHKKKKMKQISKGQRHRRERDLAKAEAIQDQLENKVTDAKTRLKRRQARKSLWEDVNKTSQDEVRKTIKGPGRFEALNEDNEEEDHPVIEPFHGDTEIKVLNGVQVPAFAAGTSLVIPGRLGIPVSTKPQPSTTETTKPETDEIN